QWKFWHNLSLSLRIPVEELKDRITAREYQSWKHYELVAGPFGQERADYNTALIVKTLHEITSMILAVNTGKTEELPKLEDCLLKFKYVLKEFTENSEAENVKRFIGRWRR
ncbi:MAG: DUF4035 domain-containing protein, partial [Bacteroidales bacterium]|nr:DUF4035 domain-containing protein [Bacteroidales bacterium]